MCIAEEVLDDGFTGERHARITHGRVEVYVPEAHRFGETGVASGGRLLRFDLRDDRLRLQHVERQERDIFFRGHPPGDAGRQRQAAARTALPAWVQRHLYGRGDPRGADRLRPEGARATAFFSWPSRGSVAAGG